jgi:TnpA family transposase
MPVSFLTASEREKFDRFPEEIISEDIIIYFTLNDSDLAQLPSKSGGYNRLGYALQLCTLRFLGYCPNDFSSVPTIVIDYLAGQIQVNPQEIEMYGRRDQTRTEHLQKIIVYLGFRQANEDDLNNLSNWLFERALEHNKPSLLFQMTCDWLFINKIVRPGLTILERMVSTARNKVQEATYVQLDSLLTPECQSFLDSILVVDEQTGRTIHYWLRFGACGNTSSDILKTIDKLSFLKNNGVDKWNLSINPNRKKYLAQVGRKSTNMALQYSTTQKRYPILICFLHSTYEEVIDELIEQFDRCLADCYSRSKSELKKYQLAIAKINNEKIRILRDIAHILLDSSISDYELRKHIYQIIPEEQLRAAIDECNTLIRPKDDKSYDYFANRYSYIREFAPKFLTALEFKSNQDNDSLLKAIMLLRMLNEDGTRKVPEGSPIDFMSTSWLTYVNDSQGNIIRRYYEISTLWELRSSLRSGDIWVENSRRYANPESYLIPKEKWQSIRDETCRLLSLPENGEERIEKRKKELESLLSELDEKVIKDKNVRIEKDKLVLTPLKAEELPESSIHLQQLITERLPQVDLTDLLIEVDSFTHFTDHFEHASGNQSRNKELLIYIYASILTQACNFGFLKMAEVSNLSYSQLTWYSNWYLREETFQQAINILVNYQYHQPLSKYWGGGTMSSSDGQRFPVAVKARNTSIIPPYYGYGRILTYYSWTSDQHSQWGSKPIPSTIRDSTYVLDGILDNETELPIYEHTTDTAGYTERIFAFFDCLGYQFSPRIRDLGDQHIYRINKNIRYKKLEPILKGTINVEFILKHWDSILRVMASIKLGWVAASLFISKLQSQTKQSNLSKALQQYGQLIKSIYIPKYVCREEQQRRVSLQLNKGESLHDLRRWLMFADEGKIRKSQLLDQATQASALTLVTNAIIIWNTKYMEAVIEQLKLEGYKINEEDLRHISPCRFDHINKYGKYFYNVEKELNRVKLRPLKEPKNFY